jgi:cell division protein FtsB
MGGIVGKIVIIAVGFQLSAFSQAQPPASGAAVEQLRRELAECRAECERLRDENAALRRAAAETSPPSSTG